MNGKCPKCEQYSEIQMGEDIRMVLRNMAEGAFVGVTGGLTGAYKVAFAAFRAERGKAGTCRNCFSILSCCPKCANLQPFGLFKECGTCGTKYMTDYN